MNEVVIVSAKRTPIGVINGRLSRVSAKDLLKTAMKAAVDEIRLDPGEIDQIIAGNVDMPSDAPNIGRIAALELGYPMAIPAYMTAQNCGSALQALICGAQSIMLGEAEVCLAAGTESMSQIPYILRGARQGFGTRHQQLTDRVWEMLHDPVACLMMGETAEVLADEFGITRKEQDEYALSSYERAQRAQNTGIFDRECVPVEVRGRKGEKLVVDKDELPAEPMTMEKLAGLKPVFKKDGTVTPGNSCGMNDGAAAVVLMSRRKAEALGLSPLARIVSYATVGLDPKRMGLGPAYALPKALQKANMSIGEIDLFELNEAFAAQTLACVRLLGIDREKLNPFGGAIALGHPVGATGIRLVVTLLNGLALLGKRFGAATLCVGGGMGGAVIVERL